MQAKFREDIWTMLYMVQRAEKSLLGLDAKEVLGIILIDTEG